MLTCDARYAKKEKGKGKGKDPAKALAQTAEKPLIVSQYEARVTKASVCKITRPGDDDGEPRQSVHR